jgi:hypothetical protein
MIADAWKEKLRRRINLDTGTNPPATSFDVIGESHSPNSRLDGAAGESARTFSLSFVHFKTSLGESP